MDSKYINSNTNMTTFCLINQKIFSEILIATNPSYPTFLRLLVVEVSGHLFHILSSSLSQLLYCSNINRNKKLISYELRKKNIENYKTVHSDSADVDITNLMNKSADTIVDVDGIYEKYQAASKAGIDVIVGVLDDGTDEVKHIHVYI